MLFNGGPIILSTTLSFSSPSWKISMEPLLTLRKGRMPFSTWIHHEKTQGKWEKSAKPGENHGKSLQKAACASSFHLNNICHISIFLYIYTTTRWFNLYSTLKKQQQIAILWCSPASSTPAVVSGSCSGVTATTSSTSGIRSLSVFLTRGDMICTSPNLSANPHTYTNTVIIKK